MGVLHQQFPQIPIVALTATADKITRGKIFAATGENRNQLVLMMVIDMAVYHIFCIHNPQKLSQVRKDRYERARCV